MVKTNKNDNKKNKRKRKFKSINQVKHLYPFKSILEKKIYKIIRRIFPQQKIQINKKGLLKTNNKLELDLYFPKIKIGIEIQGPYHYGNEKVILKDYHKKILFFHKNIRIIYIYTNTYENRKHSLKKCINIIHNEQKKIR